MENVFEFHGEKCCLIEKEDNSDIRFILKTIKRYEGKFTSWFGDNVRYSLCQCPYCGAYYLHEETEHISWSDGNDYFTDLFYQVESPQHAEELMQESLIHIKYEGPRVFVRD